MIMTMTLKGPSQNLKWEELFCKDGSAYPETFVRDGRVFRLAEAFEEIRAIWNRPIVILSAYRTPEHNRRIGGARNSQHLHGRALDLKPPRGVRLELFYEQIQEIAREIGLGGLGKYKTFVHIDTRPRTNGHIAYWKGTGVKDS